ncbi:MAG: hypothetical protein AAF490_09045 [Chloroflexota bacterium]
MMKPLVYYCRWQGASLRLRGRDETAVWGHLVTLDNENNESLQAFRYNLKTREITLIDGAENRVHLLDEKGVIQQ